MWFFMFIYYFLKYIFHLLYYKTKQGLERCPKV